MCGTAESVLWYLLLCLFFYGLDNLLLDSSGLYLNFMFSYIYKLQKLDIYM